MKIFKTILEYVGIIVLVIIIRVFLITPVQVQGLSMYSTLHNKDIMILNIIGLHVKPVKRFDIVVVNYKEDPLPLIKRVVGLPGDSLKFVDNKLYINDKEVKEPFLKEGTDDFDLSDIGYEVIPKDKYFVMGDNRDNSTDSRYIGLIDKKDILGKTNLIVFPFSHFGIVK